VEIDELRGDDAEWAATVYREIRFAPTPPGSPGLIARDGGERVGLGRLVAVGGGAFELGGIWTAEAARGRGVAAAMVRALIDHSRRAGAAELWCVPFEHLVDYYARFGFVRRAAPWPSGVDAKVADCVARALPPVAVLRRAPG
jgi:predicted N-acetyltransferase YhbS